MQAEVTDKEIEKERDSEGKEKEREQRSRMIQWNACFEAEI
jgi:hypothetical protein